MEPLPTIADMFNAGEISLLDSLSWYKALRQIRALPTYR